MENTVPNHWVQTDGYGPQYVYRVSRSEAKKLCDAIGIDIEDL